MTHYICKGGCKGVSDTPGTCQTSDCADFNKELLPCDCVDQLHQGEVKESVEETNKEE